MPHPFTPVASKPCILVSVRSGPGKDGLSRTRISRKLEDGCVILAVSSHGLFSVHTYTGEVPLLRTIL